MRTRTEWIKAAKIMRSASHTAMPHNRSLFRKAARYAIRQARVLMVIAVLLVAGCANTLNGFGSLVQGMGQDMKDASQVQYDRSMALR